MAGIMQKEIQKINFKQGTNDLPKFTFLIPDNTII